MHTIHRAALASLTMLALFLLMSAFRPAEAQTRLSDKDVETLMANLKEDSKQFESAFKSAVSKSTIRNTTREKETVEMVAEFQKSTETMLKEFQESKQAPSLPSVLAMRRQVADMMSGLMLGGSLDPSWSKVGAELDSISQAFGISVPGRG